MSDILELGRKKAEEYFGEGGEGFQNLGRRNAYECKNPACRRYIITIDRAPGVTPFIVRCRKCNNEAYSKMYRVQEHLTPTHEWYRPETLDGIDKALHDHISKGGLILRAIPGEPDEWISPFDVHRKHSADQAALLQKRLAMVEAERKLAELDHAPEEITAYGYTYRRVDQ